MRGDISIKFIARSIVLVAVLAGLDLLPAAAAGVEKMVSDCGAGSCPYDSASIATPTGWVHDDFAERTLHIKVLVRSGQSFTTVDAFILAAVLPNFGNDPIADHV